MTRKIALVLAALAALATAGAGSPASAPACKYPAGWQKLANRIHAPVYCPGWLPDPLTSQIGGRWNNLNSVDPDRSYLEGFVWQETGSGEIHINLRAYPGVTAIPTCVERDYDSGKKVETKPPCFADARGHARAQGIDATVYTVNQDADRWHVAYVWRHAGVLYMLSEHVAPPLSYKQVVANLDRMLRSLVLVNPR